MELCSSQNSGLPPSDLRSVSFRECFSMVIFIQKCMTLSEKGKNSTAGTYRGRGTNWRCRGPGPKNILKIQLFETKRAQKWVLWVQNLGDGPKSEIAILSSGPPTTEILCQGLLSTNWKSRPFCFIFFKRKCNYIHLVSFLEAIAPLGHKGCRQRVAFQLHMHCPVSWFLLTTGDEFLSRSWLNGVTTKIGILWWNSVAGFPDVGWERSNQGRKTWQTGEIKHHVPEEISGYANDTRRRTWRLCKHHGTHHQIEQCHCLVGRVWTR